VGTTYARVRFDFLVSNGVVCYFKEKSVILIMGIRGRKLE